jgi:hypothetical protein
VPTATDGPLEEAAALSLLIKQQRAALAELTARRRTALAKARESSTATVAAIARRVYLSPGRISQLTKPTAGMETTP